MYYVALTWDEPGWCSWYIHPAIDKINKVTTRKHAMRGCRLLLMENKHCMGVNHGQWKTIIAWMKKHGHVACVGVLRLYIRSRILTEVSSHWLFQLPTTPLCVQTLSNCSHAPHNCHCRRIKVKDYIFIYMCSSLFIKIQWSYTTKVM